MFKVNDIEYEYVGGQFFKRVATLPQGASFGEIALQRKCLRTATIKTESDAKFAYLVKDDYRSSLMKIAEDIDE